jgi:RecB family exonuclease
MTVRPAPANTMVRFLADFCREHPLDEKIFIVPSHIAGRQIGQALAREAGAWINLRFVTLTALAQEILEKAGAAAPGRPLTAPAQLALVDRSFRALLAEGRLEYFGRAGASPGLVRTLFRAIQDLRFAGLTSAGLRPDRFVVARKGRELALLLGRYEKALDETGRLDSAGLMVRALGAVAAEPRTGAWHLCLRDIPLRKVESNLARAAAGGEQVLVPGDPVFGLSRPRHCWPLPEGEPDGSAATPRLSWLFAPGQAPPPKGEEAPALFRALGPANECREILRRIYSGKVRFDDVEVLSPPGSPHPVVFHLLAVRAGLPVTFGDGLPVSFTSPGRLFFGLADWLEDDLSVDRLCRLLAAGDLVLPSVSRDEPLPARTACRHLKAAMIGWGRDRYLDRLKALRAGRETGLGRAGRREREETGESPAEREARLRAEMAEIDGLISGLGRLFEILPETGSGRAHDLREVSAAFVKVMGTFSRSASGTDGAAREALRARLEEIMDEAPDAGLSLKEALDLLREAAASVRVGASPPRPGHLHVADCLSGGWSGRPVTFVAGLDEASFPGRGLQDPVLLDEERTALSASLPTAADALRAGLFGLASVLAGLRGTVTLSYPSFDITEDRASFPSSVVLQAYRLGKGDRGLDYTALEGDLPDAAGFVPAALEQAFDEADWWLARLAGPGRTTAGAASVEANYANLAAGIAADAARAGPLLTEYDGLVDIAAVRDRIDPVTGRKAVMSATRLELLARCPLGYFLRHVLGVKPPETVEFDRSRWLDPLQRGSLIHAILCQFMQEVTARKEKVGARRHGPLMAETAGRHIERWRTEIPPPSEAVFESARRDILESLDVFLAAEENREEEVEPLEFEKEFKAEEIGLGGGRSFLLGGFIDRLDRTGPERYRVIDYKTGSPAAYEGLVEFGRGRVLQHALYAVAVERILARERPGTEPQVTASGYFFPTRRGEGREILVRGFDRDRLRRLLGDLLEILRKGRFIAGPGARCDFCDYAATCGGAPAVTEGKRALLENLLGLIDSECIIAGVRYGGGDIDLAPACGGDPEAARRRVEANLAVYADYDKLDEYE